MKEHVLRTVEGIRLGDTIQFKNLSIVPLFSNNAFSLDYISLKKGLEQKLVEITEVSEGGSVPTLNVINNANHPLFILDGEELIGAKQNRIVNTSMLLAAKSNFQVPVSCTERGRWSYNSRSFSDSGVVMSSKARYSKSKRVSASLRNKRGYDAMQSEVWNDIEHMHAKYATSSGTRAMKDAFIQKENDIKDYIAAFPLQLYQNGMIVFQNGKLVGGEFISNPNVYTDLHVKLIKSFAIEAMHERDEIQTNKFDLQKEASQNLHLLKGATATEHEPIGLGKDIRLETSFNKASALEHEGEVVHISFFPKEDADNDEDKKQTNPTPTPPRRRWGLGEFVRRRRNRNASSQREATRSLEELE